MCLWASCTEGKYSLRTVSANTDKGRKTSRLAKVRRHDSILLWEKPGLTNKTYATRECWPQLLGAKPSRCNLHTVWVKCIIWCLCVKPQKSDDHAGTASGHFRPGLSPRLSHSFQRVRLIVESALPMGFDRTLLPHQLNHFVVALVTGAFVILKFASVNEQITYCKCMCILFLERD